MVKLIMLCFWEAPVRGQITFELASYCTSFYGCELLDLTCVQLLDFCTAWRKGVRRVWDLPHTNITATCSRWAGAYLCWTKFVKRSMNFVITCLSHTSSLVKYVAHHSIRFGLNVSLIGRNVLNCSRRYGFDVSDVLTNNSRFLSDTIHSCARSEVTEAQLHEIDLLFECILIRDSQAALPTWFPSSDVQLIVNYMVGQLK